GHGSAALDKPFAGANPKLVPALLAKAVLTVAASAGQAVGEPPEIQKLREELQAKEQALQSLRQRAMDHMNLIEVLERETFVKEEAIRKLRTAEAAQKEVAKLLAEIRRKDEGLDLLRRRAEEQEASLSSLGHQSKAKGEMVRELLRGLAEADSPRQPVPQHASCASPSARSPIAPATPLSPPFFFGAAARASSSPKKLQATLQSEASTIASTLESPVDPAEDLHPNALTSATRAIPAAAA
ncbi:unnamed protein product, partial [Polarella glacialis]